MPAVFKTLISYFDLRLGPGILCELDAENPGIRADITAKEDFPVSGIDETIAKLMDIHPSGEFFVHYIPGLLSINLTFSVEDPDVRGGRHMLMVSFTAHGIDNPKDLAELLKNLDEYKRRLIILRNSLVKNALFKKLLNAKSHERRGFITENPDEKICDSDSANILGECLFRHIYSKGKYLP